jgi:hypothetical protein
VLFRGWVGGRSVAADLHGTGSVRNRTSTDSGSVVLVPNRDKLSPILDSFRILALLG